MKTIMFCLLGNRDLQIKSGIAHPVVQKYFVPLNNDSPLLIIDKSYKAPFKFIEGAQETLDHFESLKEHVMFPMIEASLAHLGEKPDVLVFSTSKQNPIYAQDCYALAEFAERLYSEKGFETHVALCVSKPTHMEPMLEYYSALFDQWDQPDHRIIVSNSGGTPTMRAASHFAALFKGFQFIHVINSQSQETDSFQEQVVTSTYQQQEMRILRELIFRNLQTYDYQGIINLLQTYARPGRYQHMEMMMTLQQVYDISCHALNTYNLHTDLVDPSKPYRTRGVEALELIYSNMIACFYQGAYADVIGRIFRLEEAIGQVLMYQWMDAQGLITEDDKVMGQTDREGNRLSFDAFLADRFAKSDIIERFAAEALIDVANNRRGGPRTVKAFKYIVGGQPSEVRGGIINGKNLFFFLFKSLGEHIELYQLWDQLNGGYDLKQNPLAKLRNHSVLGHGHKGVSQQELENITGNFDEFCQQLSHLLVPALDRPIRNYFDQQNQRIREWLS